MIDTRGLVELDQRAALYQPVVNARPIPDMRHQRVDRTPIAVRVRLLWQHDGVEHRDACALDWADRDALVEPFDARHQTHGVWLDAGDVTRLA